MAWAGGTILIYGDSLSAAYGLAQDAGWAALLQARLKQEGMDYTVTNASISGETTSGGAARIAAALKAHKPRVIIVALGGNDGLRGLPAEQMRANLAKINPTAIVVDGASPLTVDKLGKQLVHDALCVLTSIFFH